MSRLLIVTVLLATTLAACARREFDGLSYSADFDATTGVAIFACKSSTSDRCIFRFDSPAHPTTLTIAKGETAAVNGVRIGSDYCATTGAGGAPCHAQALQSGLQTVHHQKRRSF